MTTTKNVGKAYMLSEVEKQIRKDIPRLMELREGCYVMDKITECVYRVYKVTDKIYKLCGVTNDDNWDINKKYFDSSVKIIGHDIMLNDVLEWFILNEISIIPQCSKSESIMMLFYAEYDEWDNFYHYNVPWDLSSPYLKNQSEKLIKFLYNLIKE